MSYEDPGAEVAEDFRTALEDMTSMTRVEIMNLCQIARENTEYALEISEVLQAHINKTAPHRKLAAFYVLDAIVKNVGTPYTLYVAPKLYTTFMEAYARVENNVRRKMEEMLKTWKEPVPGSMDKKPVFPPDVVLPIENALIKAHTSAMQTLQQQGRHPQAHAHVIGRPPPGAPVRDTPTPPGGRQGSAAPRGPLPAQPYAAPTNGSAQGYPPQQPHSYGTPQPTPPQFPPLGQSYTQYGHGTPPVGQQPGYGAAAPISADVLNRNVADLIFATRVEASRNPHDASIQTRLKALMDLQTILQAKNLPPAQLELVKNQVDELAVKIRAAPAGASGASAPLQVTLPVGSGSAPSTHTHTPTPSAPVAVSVPPPAMGGVAPSSIGPPTGQSSVSIDSLLGPGALAALLGRRSETPQTSTPVQSSVAAIRSPPPQNVTPIPHIPSIPPVHYTPSVPAVHPPPPVPHVAPTPPTQDPMALLAQLRQAGIIKPGAPQNPPGMPAPPSLPGMPSIPPSLASLLPSLAAPQPVTIKSVTWTKGSLEVIRISLSSMLYEEQGPPCSQCGRRFKKDDKGKKQKTAHMDWHFRVRQRMADAEKRGQYRSYYVSRSDWVNSREDVDLDHTHADSSTGPGPNQQNSSSTPTGGGGGTAGSRTNKKPEQKFIPVPDAASGINTVCSICQDKFQNKWLDSAQEWVWLDVILVGGRAYHASCHDAATHDREERGGTPGAGGGGMKGTPEPVLGKRKMTADGEGKVGKRRS